MIDKILKKLKYIYFLLKYYLSFIKFFLFSNFQIFLKQIKLLIVELIKFTKIWARKVYVWQILSIRNRWYLSKNKNYYNPTLQATVYQWNSGWNIARFNIHHQGYKTKKLAQEAAFKMWMKERSRMKKLLKRINENHKLILQENSNYLQDVKEQSIGFVFKDQWFVTRYGDIELKVVYNSKEWRLNWTEYERVTKCVADWWCSEKDCDFDELDLSECEVDDCCRMCPRIPSERFAADSYFGDNHNEIVNPKNLEEVRQNIIKNYHKLPYNGLKKNDLYKIMYTKWVHL